MHAPRHARLLYAILDQSRYSKYAKLLHVKGERKEGGATDGLMTPYQT